MELNDGEVESAETCLKDWTELSNEYKVLEVSTVMKHVTINS
jgi:hypothetical protein